MDEKEIKGLKDIIKELLEENRTIMEQVVKESKSTMEQQYAIINVKLDNIQLQTEKHNGRMTRAEEDIKQLAIDDQKHYNNCPNSTKIETLQKEVNQVVSSKAFIAKTITINSVILGILATIITIYLNMTGKK